MLAAAPVTAAAAVRSCVVAARAPAPPTKPKPLCIIHSFNIRKHTEISIWGSLRSSNHTTILVLPLVYPTCTCTYMRMCMHMGIVVHVHGVYYLRAVEDDMSNRYFSITVGGNTYF